MSPNYISLFKIDRSAIGKHILDFDPIPADERQMVATRLERVIVEKRVIVNRNHVSSGGKSALMLWANKPVLDYDGQIIEIHCVGRIIKEMRTHPRDARKANDKK